MPAVRLGKIHLRWCDKCAVPVLEQRACDACGEPTREVSLTPPGDARPAFAYDIERARALIDSQFGEGCGAAAIPDGRLALLNKAPDLDRMDEVIIGGHVVGAMRYDISGGEKFMPRPRTATRIQAVMSKGWAKVDGGAADAIRGRKASALAVGVLECSPDIAVGDDVVVLDGDGSAVSVGVSKMTSSDMLRSKRGTAVKTRWAVTKDDFGEVPAEASWEEAVGANREVIDRRSAEAHRFVRETVDRHSLPVAVSYSGGKDSLATLLLVIESDVSPKMLFVDTGLEFDETTKNVKETADRYALDLVVEGAGDAFWKNIGRFGPPAKDFRWCCKTCKLGPATRLIQKHFPGGVLSFIGQRAYESESRARKGKTWRNPWTPNQVGASPIQKWTALHVWLYLFDRKAAYNPLYERGFERIGCFMCPSADLADLTRAREAADEYGRWHSLLESQAASGSGLPDEWLRCGLWRWRRVPRSILNAVGLEASHIPSGHEAAGDHEPLKLHSVGGYSPCVGGLSMEGAFSRSLDMDRVGNLLNIIGKVSTSPDRRIAEVDGITVFAEGAVMVKAEDEEDLRSKTSMLTQAVIRAMECAGCGICVGRCLSGALNVDGQVAIDEECCDHCGSCLGPCPVVSFREEELDL
ncbi:MAG: phosphoadenosine phosphosulfate reductase family protein [Methanobacteriota archaeon]|nr:MAG: phosphoadenosine phosphosulfate reductase family protein [Euryarchaeota archaeon]